jgi:hypothetical protein
MPLSFNSTFPTVIIALPATPGSTVYSTPIDLGMPGNPNQPIGSLLGANRPSFANLPIMAAIAYRIEQDCDFAFAHPETVDGWSPQVGAAGGVAADCCSTPIRKGIKRYIRLAISTDANCGDCSANSATFGVC